MIDVVCGVIEDGDGRFLVCRRPAGKHLGGLWEFPGGKVEDGESHAAALVRELREELAIEVAVHDALPPVVWHYERASIRLLPYRCTITRGVPHPHEHDQLRWCAPHDFTSLDWAPADLPVLDALRGMT
jgi:8-oxo-dGTP diphosphatase